MKVQLADAGTRWKQMAYVAIAISKKARAGLHNRIGWRRQAQLGGVLKQALRSDTTKLIPDMERPLSIVKITFVSAFFVVRLLLLLASKADDAGLFDDESL